MALPCSGRSPLATVVLRRRPLLVGLAVSLVSAAACNGLWGIDDLSFGGAPAGTAGSGASAGTGGATSAGGAAAGAAGTGGSGGAGTPTGGEAGSAGSGNPLDFFDDFERADGPDLGNGWIEKDPPAFELAAGQVLKGPSSASYRNQVLYRPSGEDLLDVEVSVEVIFAALPPHFPEIFVRGTGQATADYLDAYTLYLNSADDAYLVRQEGNNFGTTLAAIDLSPVMVANGRYRLTLSAIGTAPVQLEARVDAHQGGSSWHLIGSASRTDSDAGAFTEAGTVGLTGSYPDPQFRFDNFRRTAR